ncbi:hypothetical protein C8R46DRAFT_1042289 [Mycena filopes]|nr:hypothetical protein C8R46DRAFT_1042289 [Mycena filopes]
MCPCFLPRVFGHGCGGHPAYDPDLDVIFPLGESHYTVSNYLEHFFYSIPHARTVTNVHLRSLQYCHTRGRTGYPFLLVRLQHRYMYARPIVLKLQGWDGPPRSRSLKENIFGISGTWRDVTDTADDNSLVVVGGLHQRVKHLVGAQQGYDVCYTMKGVWSRPAQPAGDTKAAVVVGIQFNPAIQRIAPYWFTPQGSRVKPTIGHLGEFNPTGLVNFAHGAIGHLGHGQNSIQPFKRWNCFCNHGSWRLPG